MSLAILVKILSEWKDPHIIYLHKNPDMRKIFLSLDKYEDEIQDSISLLEEECSLFSSKPEKEISQLISESLEKDLEEEESEEGFYHFYRICHTEIIKNKIKVFL
ncbi:hypothetical protein HY498_04035 [Candidatus Woesearchaeota archaeon]|nr:hypothetical protein [Candidatus Woesearchaeota archaeon]